MKKLILVAALLSSAPALASESERMYQQELSILRSDLRMLDEITELCIVELSEGAGENSPYCQKFKNYYLTIKPERRTATLLKRGLEMRSEESFSQSMLYIKQYEAWRERLMELKNLLKEQ